MKSPTKRRTCRRGYDLPPIRFPREIGRDIHLALRGSCACLNATVSNPAAAFSGLILVLLLPSIASLAPLGISSSGVHGGGWSYEAALLSSSVGCWVMSRTLEGFDGVLRRLTATHRHACQLLAFLGAGGVAITLALLPALALAPGFTLVGLAASFRNAAAPLATIAAAGCLLLRLRFPSGMLPWLLLVAIASGPLLLPAPGSATSLAALAAALLGATWLLDHPPGGPR